MATKRIKKANIKFVSLVPRGKNRLQVIYKADGTFELPTLVKASEQFDENGELLAVVYPVGKPDTDGHWADAEAVRGMAHSHARNGLALDIHHNGKPLTKEQAYVAESFVIQKGDQRFEGWKDYEGNPADVTGGWAQLIKVEDPILRKAYRDGGWAGVSLYGHGELEEAAPPEREGEMPPLTKEELESALKKSNESIVEKLTELAKGITEALKGLPEQKPPATGDQTPSEEMKKAEAEKAHLEAELQKAQDKIRDLQSRSNQPVSTSEKNEALKKEEELFKAGQELGKYINQRFFGLKS